jgi:hypothetical protein
VLSCLGELNLSRFMAAPACPMVEMSVPATGRTLKALGW